jgi:hypothetical protein
MSNEVTRERAERELHKHQTTGEPYSYRRIFYRAGYKYQLAFSVLDEYLYANRSHIPAEGIWTDFIGVWHFFDEGIDRIMVWAKKDYAWDGASGPALDTQSFMRPSLKHDIGYQLIRLGLLPSAARHWLDDELFEDCKTDGMWGFRAYYSLQAVHYFGSSAAKPESDRRLLTAPKLEDK